MLKEPPKEKIPTSYSVPLEVYQKLDDVMFSLKINHPEYSVQINHDIVLNTLIEKHCDADNLDSLIKQFTLPKNRDKSTFSVRMNPKARSKLMVVHHQLRKRYPKRLRDVSMTAIMSYLIIVCLDEKEIETELFADIKKKRNTK